MTKDYHRPCQAVEYELVVKNSRFIAIVCPATSSADIDQALRQARENWPKASHYCTASVLGAPFDYNVLASSDDGEPSGTAGRPMLMVLQNAPLGDVAAVVVRYFGGVKLGTGGLQRAYSQSVSEALQQLKTELVIYRQAYNLTYPYSLQGAIEPLWKQFEVIVSDSQFSEDIEQTVQLTPHQTDELQQRLDAVSQGRVKLRPIA